MRQLFALLGLLAFFALPGPSRSAEPYQIHVLLSLTGTNAFPGNEEAKGLQAVERFVNASGGVNGRSIRFVIEDDQSSPQLAVQLLNQIVATKPPIVFGGGTVGTCNAVTPLVRDNGPVWYCYSAGVHPVEGGYTFSSGFSSSDQIASAVAYLKSRGWNKVGVITSTDATGQEADRTIDAVFAIPENRNGSIVDREHFNAGDISVGAQIARIKAAGAQALIAWTTGTPLGTVLHGMKDSGTDLPVVTTGGNLSYTEMEAYGSFMPSALLIAGPPLVVPDQIPNGPIKHAINQFADMLKPEGVRPDIGLATPWDSALIVVGALRRLGPNPTASQIRSAIGAIGDWPGVFGTFNYRANPQRGVGRAAIVIVRWDPAGDRWVAAGAPRSLSTVSH